MAKFMTTKEASEKWDITERRINVLCKEGRITGAVKQGKSWLIPADAKKITGSIHEDEVNTKIINTIDIAIIKIRGNSSVIAAFKNALSIIFPP